MRHLKSGRKLKRTSSHRKALLNNLATSLFEHKKVVTTEAKAKELRPFAENLITKAKHALRNEKLGLLPEGHKVDIHNRRIVGRFITNKAVLQELFNTIAPMVEERPGGYTRIIKLGTRRGDGSPTAIIELVDWSAPQDGAVSTKSRRRGKAAQTTTKKQKPAAKEEVIKAESKTTSEEAVETQIVAPETIETSENISETIDTTIKEQNQEEVTTETIEETTSEAEQGTEEIKAESEQASNQEAADIKNDSELNNEEPKTDSEEENKENIS
ncbi:MAG: 50S ribosomal protein L17 [Candidatus Kapabacteria bacterium]|nr:50S ribosomal protein L17 [Candidatus Kapabacteria bacterium]